MIAFLTNLFVGLLLLLGITIVISFTAIVIFGVYKSLKEEVDKMKQDGNND